MSNPDGVRPGAGIGCGVSVSAPWRPGTSTVRREELRTETEGEVIVDSEGKRVPPAR